jgi:hypothetical protein
LDSSSWQCPRSQGTVSQFLAQKSITEIEHPIFSPFMAPNDYWLFQE